MTVCSYLTHSQISLPFFPFFFPLHMAFCYHHNISNEIWLVLGVVVVLGAFLGVCGFFGFCCWLVVFFNWKVQFWCFCESLFGPYVKHFWLMLTRTDHVNKHIFKTHLLTSFWLHTFMICFILQLLVLAVGAIKWWTLYLTGIIERM